MDWRDEYKVHPAADVFPMLPDEELDELAADIKANELLEPVEYWGGPVQSLVDDDDGEIGEILDGRNRLEGCERAGEKPRFKAVYTDDPAFAAAISPSSNKPISSWLRSGPMPMRRLRPSCGNIRKRSRRPSCLMRTVSTATGTAFRAMLARNAKQAGKLTL